MLNVLLAFEAATTWNAFVFTCWVSMADALERLKPVFIAVSSMLLFLFCPRAVAIQSSSITRLKTNNRILFIAVLHIRCGIYCIAIYFIFWNDQKQKAMKYPVCTLLALIIVSVEVVLLKDRDTAIYSWISYNARHYPVAGDKDQQYLRCKSELSGLPGRLAKGFNGGTSLL